MERGAGRTGHAAAALALVLIGAPVLAQTANPLDDGPNAAAPGASTSASAAPAGESSGPKPYAPIVLSPGVSTNTPPPAASAAKPQLPDQPAEPRRWYGWQSLLAGYVIAGTGLVAMRSTAENKHLTIFVGASTLFILGPPLIHVAHGSGKKALYSAILNAGFLGGGAVVGAFIVEGAAGCGGLVECKLSTVDFAALGAAGGALIAPMVDALWLGWTEPSRKPATESFVWSPRFATNGTTTTFGLVGAF